MSSRHPSLFLISMMLFGPAAELRAQQAADEEGRIRFRAVDIFIDSGSTPLAAYQVEFTVTNGVAKIAGIEGGQPEVFREPPYYDPKAMQHDRVIIASFTTALVTNLPTGKTRVATIHLQTQGAVEPNFDLKLETAGDAHGNKISPQASLEERRRK
jgi:hypothetical protein